MASDSKASAGPALLTIDEALQEARRRLVKQASKKYIKRRLFDPTTVCRPEDFTLEYAILPNAGDPAHPSSSSSSSSLLQITWSPDDAIVFQDASGTSKGTDIRLELKSLRKAFQSLRGAEVRCAEQTPGQETNLILIPVAEVPGCFFAASQSDLLLQKSISSGSDYES